MGAILSSQKSKKPALIPAAAISKGEVLQKKMQADDYMAAPPFTEPRSAQSEFLDQALVQSWGYTASCRPYMEPDSLEEIYKHFSLPTNQAAFEVTYNHNNRFFLNGAQKGSTDAHFINHVNRTNGFLIAFENHGPAYMAEDSGRAIPELKHWSDIAYLQWADPIATAAPGSGKLKYVLRNAVENEDTLDVITKILDEYRRLNEEEEKWEPIWPDRIGFMADSKQAQALLGTPNGHGVAWLLIQHKHKKLSGHKFVDKVTLFFTENAERGSQPSLLFHIKDVM